MLTSREQTYCNDIIERINQMRSHLVSEELESPVSVDQWYKYLSKFKDIQGNLNNYVSFIATLMAKQYLNTNYGIDDFDAAEKPQGVPGLDIDIKTRSGQRIIAEIKTIYPYQFNDFGAQQKNSFKKDFDKLNKEIADDKFLFVTENKSFSILKSARYSSQIPGVKIVLLPSGEEYIG